MTPQEYEQWLSEARRLIAQWSDPWDIPCIDDPICDRWESMDRQESHTIIAWSGVRYNEAWANRIYDCIAEAINPNKGAWDFQKPFYAEICSKFFRPSSRDFVFNAIFVTPDRLPMRLWPKLGRKPILETTFLPTYKPPPKFQAKEITLEGMSLPLNLTVGSILWVRRPEDGYHPLITTVSRRIFRPWRYMVEKLFQVDFHNERDLAAIENAMIPALAEPWWSGGREGRVGMPMVQLLRIDTSGYADLVVLESSHASGLLVDLRWSRQPFAALMMSAPDFAAALRAAMASRSKLIRT